MMLSFSFIYIRDGENINLIIFTLFINLFFFRLYPVDKNRIDDIGAETVDVLKDGIIDESKKIK